jgi:hypothetical protein
MQLNVIIEYSVAMGKHKFNTIIIVATEFLNTMIFLANTPTIIQNVNIRRINPNGRTRARIYVIYYGSISYPEFLNKQSP